MNPDTSFSVDKSTIQLKKGETLLKAYPFTIDITPLDQWTNYGPAWGYRYRPNGIESYYDQNGKRQRCTVQNFPCTVYLQPNDPANVPSPMLSGIIAVLFRAGSFPATGITVTPSRGDVTLAQITGNTVAIHWLGKKAGDPVTITISETKK